jgi:hypothetical protein
MIRIDYKKVLTVPVGMATMSSSKALLCISN